MKEDRKMGMRTKVATQQIECAQEAMEEGVGGPESAPSGTLLGVTKGT